MKYRKTFNGQNASWTKFAIIYPSRVSQMRRFRPGENLITGQRGRTRFHVVAEDDEEEREGKRIQRRRRPHGLAHAAHAHAHAAHAHAAHAAHANAAHAASSEKETEEKGLMMTTTTTTMRKRIRPREKMTMMWKAKGASVESSIAIRPDVFLFPFIFRCVLASLSEGLSVRPSVSPSVHLIGGRRGPLDASSQLYKTVYRSIGLSVHRSVRGTSVNINLNKSKPE